MNNKNQPELVKKYLKELASDIMLSLTDDEIEAIIKVEQEIRQKFSKVTKINTDKVIPADYPLNQVQHFLRSDETSHTVSQASVLSNAPAVEKEFVTIKKVVK